MKDSKKQKIVVIVGPTASGKTSLSIEIGKQFNGEIISADSRQVYKGLDLGTGKVTGEEMRGVPHHLLDIADPKDIYTAHQYVQDGRKTIDEVTSRKHVPIIVGGTFFYVDSLLGKISTPEVDPNPELRAKLESMTTKSLYEALLKLDERRAAEIDPENKRRLIRALEIIEAIGKVPEPKSKELYDVLTIGINISKDELSKNIVSRLIARIDAGMIKEVERLHADGLSFERMEDLGLEYRYISRHLQGHMTQKEMLTELETKIRQFAKRQMTWLKRDKTIKWFKKDEYENTCEVVEGFLEG